MQSARKTRRVGVYGWGVVAPGARDVRALAALLREGRSALAPSVQPDLGHALFPVGDPDFSFDAYATWIGERQGDAYLTRMRSKMGENVQFAVAAAIQALQCDPRLEGIVRGLDEGCQVFIGSGVGDLPESYRAAASLERATRAWNHFWAQPAHCEARRRYEADGTLPSGDAVESTAVRAPGRSPPIDPTTLPVDSEARFDALRVWDGFWAMQSDQLRVFLSRFAAIERMNADDEDQEKAHLAAIRKRVRAHRAHIEELGCPEPPWTSVSPDLMWNIQNAPAATPRATAGSKSAS